MRPPSNEKEPAARYRCRVVASGLANLWIDRGTFTLAFGFLTCAFGALVLTSRSAVDVREIKESRIVGILLLVAGSFFVLIQSFDQFVLRRH
jgi:hypothetical protein